MSVNFYYKILNDFTRVRNVNIDKVHRCSENTNVSGSITMSSLSLDVIIFKFLIILFNFIDQIFKIRANLLDLHCIY